MERPAVSSCSAQEFRLPRCTALLPLVWWLIRIVGCLRYEAWMGR